MAVPWLQIVNLMPSILDVSRELLKRTRKLPEATAGQLPLDPDQKGALETRIRALEENERRQAELITSMADQLSTLTAAASALHSVTRWLIVGQVITAVVAIAAVVVALR
jgi:hypothetical protein